MSRAQLRIEGDTLEDVLAQLNEFLRRHQTGGLVQSGLKLDAIRSAAPTQAPGPGDPNLLLVNVAGTVKLYLFDGSAWVVAGTQV